MEMNKKIKGMNNSEKKNKQIFFEYILI